MKHHCGVVVGHANQPRKIAYGRRIRKQHDYSRQLPRATWKVRHTQSVSNPFLTEQSASGRPWLQCDESFGDQLVTMWIQKYMENHFQRRFEREWGAMFILKGSDSNSTKLYCRLNRRYFCMLVCPDFFPWFPFCGA